MSFQVRVVGKTDKGLVRAGNEDYLYIDNEHYVYAVCDGMGGHQSGEVAAMTAAETLHGAFHKFSDALLADDALKVSEPVSPNAELLLKSIRMANRAIHNKAQASKANSGMGTTIVAAALESDTATIAHVGDSRAYRFRDGSLEPLTRDHSWVAEMQAQQNMSREEASSFVGKNVITRALGIRGKIEVDYRIEKIQPGDLFLLCSDGLCGFVDDDEIFSIVKRHSTNLDELSQQLVNLANDRGGSDNVTVILIEILQVSATPISAAASKTLTFETDAAIASEDAWLEKMFVQPAQESPDKRNTQNAKHSSKTLLSLFVLFAVVAIVFMYLASK